MDVLYDVNVKGTFWCCRAAAKVMQAQQPQGGSIINIASMSGLRATGSSIAYCSSKAAVIHMTRCLARALGPANIRVNAIAPAASATPAGRPIASPAPPATGSPATGTGQWGGSPTRPTWPMSRSGLLWRATHHRRRDQR